jgi:hypothetical protein
MMAFKTGISLYLESEQGPSRAIGKAGLMVEYIILMVHFQPHLPLLPGLTSTSRLYRHGPWEIKRGW